MSFDIEKMKADGVSEHLIYLASVDPEVLMIRVARRLENDRLFQQFLSMEFVGEIEKIYPYAVAAGLMSEADRLWLVDEGNPYKSQDGEVWYTGTLGECQDGYADAILTETDKAKTTELMASPDSYSVEASGVPMTLSTNIGTTLIYSDNGSSTDFNFSVTIESTEGIAATAKCPTDITNVEVTVAHK